MATKTRTYEMTIEPMEGGPAVRHGFHLGTDERLARDLVVERLRHGVAPVARTVGLWLGNRLVDVFDGQWTSEYERRMRG